MEAEHTLTFPAVTTGTNAITFNTATGVMSIYSTDNADAGTYAFNVQVDINLDTMTTVKSVTYAINAVITIPTTPPAPVLPLPAYVEPPAGIILEDISDTIEVVQAASLDDLNTALEEGLLS